MYFDLSISSFHLYVSPCPIYFVNMEMELLEEATVDIRDPVEAKYLSASAANSLRAAAVVPVLVVCASSVRTSAGSCLRKICRNRYLK